MKHNYFDEFCRAGKVGRQQEAGIIKVKAEGSSRGKQQREAAEGSSRGKQQQGSRGKQQQREAAAEGSSIRERQQQREAAAMQQQGSSQLPLQTNFYCRMSSSLQGKFLRSGSMEASSEVSYRAD